ncbi:MAG: hypothetical protein OXN96_19085 [Bryobacterales bacterium]|nr:hypothetical protein [Bryobacterales bacterium]
MRQVSRAEAERLGGPTDRPQREEVEWTNPRTGDRIRVDRGLDPSWASNPGLDRPRLLAEMQARDIAGLALVSAALARAAIRETVESAQLERQFASLKPGQALGDLPVAFVPEKRARLLGDEAGALLLTRQTAVKQLKHHRPNPKYPDNVPLELADYRTLLPEILERARDEHVTRDTGHWKTRRDDLLMVYERGDLWYKAVIGRDPGEKALRLVTFHNLSRDRAMFALKAARRRWSKRGGAD